MSWTSGTKRGTDQESVEIEKFNKNYKNTFNQIKGIL
jgi:ribosomal protein L31